MRKNNFLKILITVGLILALSAVLFACSDREIISAYDIAVENGFEGTEEEWLDSLKGANGLDGQKGESGNITVDDLYAAAVKNGFEGTYLEFLKEYLNTDVTYDSTFAVSKAIRSAVIVISNFTKTTYQTNIFGFPIGPEKEVDYQSGGAGVIYKMDDSGNAYVITNFHVVYDSASNQTDNISENIELYLYGGVNANSKIPASFVGGSAYYDIAVLRVSESEVLKNSDAVAATVAKNSVTVGQTAMAIGFPAGEGMSVTSGIVSVDSESIDVEVDGKNLYSLRVMRVDTAINSGNSGGGLFDSDGNLIGIVNAKNSSTQIENIGYAIPKETALSVAENIIANCANSAKKAVYKCQMGITTTVASSKAVYDEKACRTYIKETVKVVSTVEGSKADGLFSEGDILTKAVIGDKTSVIDRTFVLSEFLLGANVGDVLTVYFERDGEEMSAEITFEESDIVEYWKK